MASADSGSKESEASTNAQNCSLPVTWPSNDNSRVVRPDVTPAGAQSCVKAPFRIPPDFTDSTVKLSYSGREDLRASCVVIDGESARNTAFDKGTDDGNG